jgi:hypothetical protein
MLDDVWVLNFDSIKWKQVEKEPGPGKWPEARDGHTLAGTSGSGLGGAIFGGIGVDNSPGSKWPSKLFNDLWLFGGGAKPKFTELKLKGPKPTGRMFHTATMVNKYTKPGNLKSGAGRMVVFGGVTSGYVFNILYFLLRIPPQNDSPQLRLNHHHRYLPLNEVWVLEAKLGSPFSASAKWFDYSPGADKPKVAVGDDFPK